MKPTPMKPKIIIAHVDASGTAVVIPGAPTTPVLPVTAPKISAEKNAGVNPLGGAVLRRKFAAVILRVESAAVKSKPKVRVLTVPCFPLKSRACRKVPNGAFFTDPTEVKSVGSGVSKVNAKLGLNAKASWPPEVWKV